MSVFDGQENRPHQLPDSKGQSHSKPFHHIDTYSLVSNILLPVVLSMTIKQRLVIAQISVDVNIVTTDLPERGHVLEVIFEAVLSPVVRIRLEVDLSGNDDVDMRQPRQVQWRSDGVVLVKDNCSSLVALLEGFQDARAIVCLLSFGRLHIAKVLAGSWRRVWEGFACAIGCSYDVRPFGQVTVRLGAGSYRCRQRAESGGREEIADVHDQEE